MSTILLRGTREKIQIDSTPNCNYYIIVRGLHSPAMLLNEIEHTVPGNGGQSMERFRALINANYQREDAK